MLVLRGDGMRLLPFKYWVLVDPVTDLEQGGRRKKAMLARMQRRNKNEQYNTGRALIIKNYYI